MLREREQQAPPSLKKISSRVGDERVKQDIIRNLSEDFIRTEARLLVFQAVADEKDLGEAEDFYAKNEAVIVPSSVNRWADQNGLDVQEARQSDLKRILKQEERVAKKHKDGGVEIRGTIFSLADLIKAESEKADAIKAERSSFLEVNR